jgi:peptidoglycan/xylan/chitin deacetylase (PgdA/CDA1 family)
VFTIIAVNSITTLKPLNNPEPVFQVEGSGAVVFFTFNVLWEKEHLQDILDILDENDIHAVFFITGEWLKRNPHEAKAMLEKGHELGNYTYSRAKLLTMPEEAAADEIKSFNALSREVLGFHPLLFRPPYGEYNARIIRLAEEQDCITLLWSINLFMLSDTEKEYTLGRLEERLHDGAVLLFHTAYPGTIEKLPDIIEFIKWKGYSIGSPEQILDRFTD